ncbi:MAG: class I SAM-dependent methyltransferase [Anaerolineae bacterium]|jgi:predicted RNA methylase|nr:class I SAM-dependent methyltransferase [Anaerolineae bacterium]MBT7072005.1 class I SAM-dependent methyltransferase [Anaerolineae bacterium]MBT7324001.1 class I SAM-dependent methyltransferase [Anaerolineae bacterium]
MNITNYQREFNELQENPALFDPRDFRVRKEALDFADIITKFRPENNMALIDLQMHAQELGHELRALNASIGQDFLERFRDEKPSPQKFREWLQPYTDYAQKAWGNPHYGYESLDFLLSEVLLPEPHPWPDRETEYGMVRYEPTPASVILELTERITLSDDDIFYDLGSGLGKVTTLVHLLSGARCVGVEYQSDFCAYAKEQAHSLNLKGINYLNADARHANYQDATVFFLFNPFGGAIFNTVLEHLRLEAQQRTLRICSYGSSSQPLSELPWLERIPPMNKDEATLAIFQSSA